MKPIVIAALFASAAAAAASTSQYPSQVYPTAGRVDFCPSGALTTSHNTVTLDTAGRLYHASGSPSDDGSFSCTVADGALVTLYAEETPKVPAKGILDETPDAEHRARSTITAAVVAAEFKANSQLLIALPPIAAIGLSVPVHVYVQRNRFRDRALIRFYGSYPADSRLIITGNVVENASEPSRYPTMVDQSGGIIGWQSNRDFHMRENCRLEISENTVTVSAPSDNKRELRGIGVWNYVYMGAGSSVGINRNTVTVRGARGKWNGGIDAFAYIAEGPNTRYDVVGNTINVENGFAIGCPYARFPENEAEEMRHPTTVLVSRNSGAINKAVYFPTSKADGDVIYVGNSKNSLTSVIEISHNSFAVTGSDGNIRVAQTELRDTAAVKVVANSLSTSGGNPRIIFSWNMSAYDDSRVHVMHNSGQRTDGSDFFPGSFLLYYRGYNLYNRSESHYSYNTFKAAASSAGRKAYLLDRYPEMPLSLHSANCYKFCDNSYYGAVLNSDAALRASLPADYVAPFAAPVASCPNPSDFPRPDAPPLPESAALYDALLPNEKELPTTAAATTANGGGGTDAPTGAPGGQTTTPASSDFNNAAPSAGLIGAVAASIVGLLGLML